MSNAPVVSALFPNVIASVSTANSHQSTSPAAAPATSAAWSVDPDLFAMGETNPCVGTASRSLGDSVDSHAMNIALDIDDTITRHPEFFAWLSHALRASGHRVVVITFREDRESTAQALARLGVVHDKLITSTLSACAEHGVDTWKAAMCRQERIDVFFEDDPEQARHVAPPTVVLAPVPAHAAAKA